MEFMNHATNCNCPDCLSFRKGVILKNDAQVASRPHRQVVLRVERKNGQDARWGGELRQSLGALLLKALS